MSNEPTDVGDASSAHTNAQLFGRGEAATLAFTYFTAGLAVSVLHVTQGTDPVVMVAAALIVNSATSTLAYAAVTASGGSTLAGVFSGWLVATRFGLFAAVLGPRLWPQAWRKALAAHLAFDPSVALANREATDDDARSVFVQAGLWLCVPWWTASVIGAFLADGLGDTQALGLDAVLPAMLVAIIWSQLNSRRGVAIAALAALIALVLVEFAPGGVPVLAAAAASLLVLRSTEATGVEAR